MPAIESSALSFFSLAAAAVVQIAHESLNITVNEGDSVTFNCTIRSGNDVPVWIINDKTYAVGVDLPTRHASINQMLTVMIVNLSDVGTTYQCDVAEFRSGIVTLIVEG